MAHARVQSSVAEGGKGGAEPRAPRAASGAVAVERRAAATAVSAAVAAVVMRPRTRVATQAHIAAQAHIAVGCEGVAEASVRVHCIHATPRALGVGAARHL